MRGDFLARESAASGLHEQRLSDQKSVRKCTQNQKKSNEDFSSKSMLQGYSAEKPQLTAHSCRSSLP
jgi:hypothetical protein